MDDDSHKPQWFSKVKGIFGGRLSQNSDAMTEQEIMSMVDEAHEKGVIEENEAEMIQNIMTFGDTDAHDIMTHRKDVVAFEDNQTLQEIVDQMFEEGYSRYPVYKESIDNVIGILHYKDALKFYTKNPWAKYKTLQELPGLIRAAACIPETRAIADLIRAMQAKKTHMAIVIDEYGQTSGIVCMEDILEEIVGEIQDEYDEEERSIRMQHDNSLMIDGLAQLQDVQEQIPIDFGEVEFETLNGYLTAILGHIPTEKDLNQVICANGYRFTITSLGNKTIGMVKAEKI